jgi:hypothetical protein
LVATAVGMLERLDGLALSTELPLNLRLFMPCLGRKKKGE